MVTTGKRLVLVRDRTETNRFLLREAINNEIQRRMIINGDYNVEDGLFYTDIQPNISKLTSIVNITHSSYRVDFTKPNTISTLLGFKSSVLNHGYNKSENFP